MTDQLTSTDDMLAALMRAEAARLGQVTPPDLETVPRPRLATPGAGAASSPRRRWPWLAAAAAAAAAVTFGFFGPFAPGRGAAPAAGEVRELAGVPVTGFQVPTFVWDGSAGSEAEVSGVLSFTESGCPLMTYPFGERTTAEPIRFPNSVGVQWENGVRGVLGPGGRLYGIEGQQIPGYAGGWDSAAAAGSEWADACASESVPTEVIYVNDAPGVAPPTVAPPVPDSDLPVTITSETFAVPTFEWDPESGSDGALLEGQFTFVGDCPVVNTADGRTIGVVLANATGIRGADGLSVIQHHPDGTSRASYDGDEVAIGGGFIDPSATDWFALCSGLTDGDGAPLAEPGGEVFRGF